MQRALGPTDNVTLRDFSKRDIKRAISLAKDALGSNWTEQFVEWKYFQNPAGPICGGCAEIDGQAVGFYSAQPNKLSVRGRLASAAQAVDGMVAREARRNGLFIAIAGFVERELQQRLVELCYAFPNPLSQAAFERMNWQYVGEVPRFIRVLDARSREEGSEVGGLKTWGARLAAEAVQRVRRPRTSHADFGVSVREISEFDDRFDGLWKEVGPGLGIATHRDKDYLNWRYVDNPLIPYIRLAAEAGEQLQGYLVISLRDMGKGLVYLTEILTRPNEAEVGLKLLASAEQVARSNGAAQMHCWMLPYHSYYSDLLRDGGYVFSTARILPRMLRYTTPLLVSFPAQGSDLLDAASLANWYLTMGDHDYF